MTGAGLFTGSDIITVRRAASLAEKLTGDYFWLAPDEWTRNPYRMLTVKEVGKRVCPDEVFARVVQFKDLSSKSKPSAGSEFAIILQDPAILRALLRSKACDLWTLALFIMTHELTHIVRFRRSGVDFFATSKQREEEETIVYDITRKILAGTSNTESLLEFYEPLMRDSFQLDKDGAPWR